MPDDEVPSTIGGSSRAHEPAAGTAPRGFLRRHWGKLSLGVVVLVPIAVVAIWSLITLGFSYSSGERVGFVQKLSQKGWVCKTWEGELQMSAVPGSAPTIFAFTVRSDSLAHAIEAAAGKQLSVHYEQHVGVPSRCFGETEYFVVSMRVLNQP